MPAGAGTLDVPMRISPTRTRAVGVLLLLTSLLAACQPADAPTVASPPADQAPTSTTPTPAPTTPSPSPTLAPKVIMAAGDIACGPDVTPNEAQCHDQATADIIAAEPRVDAVLPLGDLQYDYGALEHFRSHYHRTWGRFFSITRPVPGNHEYGTFEAQGYFTYFGTRAGPVGKGYYSWDLGGWHMIALNSEIDLTPRSEQVLWLKRNLARTAARCTLAYWHVPRFASGSGHGSDDSLIPIWDALHAASVDVVLVGHEHNYERFAPQDSAGNASPDGPRSFVVGTGGRSLYPFRATIEPNSEVRNATSFGVLKMELYADSYTWEFIPIDEDGFTDSGSADCV